MSNPAQFVESDVQILVEGLTFMIMDKMGKQIGAKLKFADRTTKCSS